jgi:hypothetical protein
MLENLVKVEKIRYKKCCICGNEFIYDKTKPFVKWCCVDCGFQHAKNLKLKQIQQADKKQIKELKDKVGYHKLSYYEKILETEINCIARLIDKECPCISCGNWKTPSAGHFASVGSNKSLRYNLNNLHIQDYHCNGELSGNLLEYGKGLIKWYGKEYKEYVEYELPKLFPLMKWSKDDLQEWTQIARMIVKQLKEADRTYNATERIELRKLYNDMLGIYKD